MPGPNVLFYTQKDCQNNNFQGHEKSLKMETGVNLWVGMDIFERITTIQN